MVDVFKPLLNIVNIVIHSCAGKIAEAIHWVVRAGKQSTQPIRRCMDITVFLKVCLLGVIMRPAFPGEQINDLYPQHQASPSIAPVTTNHSISRIPSNILLKILKILFDDASPNLFSETSYLDCTAQRQSTNWHLFTHICSRWRREATTYPPFWRYIHIGRYTSDQTRAYLMRSRDVPLDVEVSCSPENATEVGNSIQYLIPHAHRVRTLLVRLVCRTSLDVLVPLFESLRDVVSIKIMSFPMRAALINLQNVAETNQLHSLRTLQLCCVPFSPELHVHFNNVRDLSLEWSYYERYPTWAEFASFLDAFSMLQRLTIREYEWTIQQGDELGMNIITLPTLTSINLTLTKFACLHILAFLDLSTTTHITIICTDYHLSDLPGPIIIPSHITNATPCRNLRISYTSVSVRFSCVIGVNNAEQHLNITLLLVNVLKAVLTMTWVGRVVNRWMRSAPFRNALDDYE